MGTPGNLSRSNSKKQKYCQRGRGKKENRGPKKKIPHLCSSIWSMSAQFAKGPVPGPNREFAPRKKNLSYPKENVNSRR